MSGFNLRYVVCGLVGGFVLSLFGCRIEGATTKADDARPRGKAACTSKHIAELRAQRLAQPWPDGPSFTDHRAQLLEVCEGGCGIACLEFARTSAGPAEVDGHHQKACELGESIGCTLAEPPTLESATKLCESGDALACGTALALEFEAAPDHSPAWDRVTQAAKDGCAANDGRSCAIEAWVACMAGGTCDASAITSASKAASLVPTAEILETLALVQCHAGAREDADATLAAACKAGHEDSCARRCEVLRDDRPQLVREAERERYDRILTAMALQADVAPHWYVALSAMDAEQLAGFETMLGLFTPAPTDAGAKAKVPEAVRERFPVLVEAILRAPQLDAKQIRYWFGRLPDMTDEQRTNLLESLRNQWWIIPGDPGKSPRAFVERVRFGGGGFAPAWTGK